MEKRGQLTRVCSSCGIQKPLSAFLQITAGQGTTYGAVCASCRSKEAREQIKKNPLEEEKSSGTQAGARIGSKQRVAMEKERIRLLKEEKENEITETKKQDSLTADKFDRTEKLEKSEKTHRDEIEAKRKRGFLTQRIRVSSQAMIGQKFEDRNSASAHFNEKQQGIETKKIEDAIKHELRLTSVDVSAATPGHVTRVDNPTFRAFMSWLGTSAPIVQAMERALGKPSAQPASAKSESALAKAEPHKSPSSYSTKQTTFANHSLSEKPAKQQESPDTSSVKDYIKNNWRKR